MAGLATREIVGHLVKALRRLRVLLAPLGRVPPYSLAFAGVGLLLAWVAVGALADDGSTAAVALVLAAGLVAAALPGFSVKLFLRLGLWKLATFTWWLLGFLIVAGLDGHNIRNTGRVVDYVLNDPLTAGHRAEALGQFFSDGLNMGLR